MERKIEFRCFDVYNQEMQEVRKLDFETKNEVYIEPYMFSDLFSTKEMILMQYTGLNDKHGKKIFEGDILKVDNYIMYGEGSKEYQEVGFEYGSFMTARYGGKAFNTYLWIIVSDGCEVVGNIYENKELIEKSS